MNYKLNLGKTDFKLNEVHLDKQKYIDMWQDTIATEKSSSEYHLLSGSPYANGNLHQGHFLNNVLKDAFIRFQRLQGEKVSLTITSDQHGLPIELEVEKLKGKSDNFLLDCRDYAITQFDIQFNQIKEFGVLTNADTIATSQFDYEAAQMQLLLDFYKENKLVQKLRPIAFCSQCNGSLAEAEIEYKSKKSDSLVVKFQLKNKLDTYLLVWTTTPYTLVANKAVAYNSNLQYVKYYDKLTGDFYVVVEAFAESEQVEYENISLENLEVISPYTNAIVPVLSADYVESQGTGLVHIAPSFGMDDYRVGCQYGLEVLDYIDNKGKFKDTGLDIKETNTTVLEYLSDNGLIYTLFKIEHSTGHCWRHKTPTFYKASTEWFLDLTQVKEKYNTLEIDFYPKSSKNRLDSMMNGRDLWCISRNRQWGVPLPFFYDVNGNIHCDCESFANEAIRLVKLNGVKAFQEMNLPNGVIKSTQIADVWLDSGFLPTFVNKPVDLVIEGTDQHRGWFNTLLCTSLSTTSQVVPKAIMTHGFVTDEKGNKYSKSSQNYVGLDKFFKENSPDVLRLMLLSQNTTNDVVISKENLDRAKEKYKKIRNTFRFILQNINENANGNISKLDLVQMHKLQQLHISVFENMKTLNVQKAVEALVKYAYEVSSYFETVKDILYCDSLDSERRKSVNCVLNKIGVHYASLVSMVMPYTAEEFWQEFKKHSKVSNSVIEQVSCLDGIMIASHEVDALDSLKVKVNQQYESMRNTEYKTLSQFEVTVPKQYFSNDELKIYLGVAKVDNGEFGVTYTQGKKCPRCWSYHYDTTELCNRCESVENGCFKKGVDSIGKLD